LKVHTEFAVDSADEFVDNCTEVLVLLYILSRRDGNLNQHNLANPFGVFCQENFKSVKLLGNTLDVIKTINTDNEFDTLELLLECLNALHNLGLFKPFLEFLGINTDGECTDGDNLALEFDCVGRCWQSAVGKSAILSQLKSSSANLQDSRTTAEEVSSIIIGVKSDQIAVQYAVEDLVTDRQNSVDFTTGEGSVQEETELDVALGVADFLAEHGGQKHEMVVVDPDQIVVLHIFCDFLCKQTVGFLVGFPCGLVEGDLTGVVVEEGPEDRVYRAVSTR
jgi:hypothetical protein